MWSGIRGMITYLNPDRMLLCNMVLLVLFCEACHICSPAPSPSSQWATKNCILGDHCPKLNSVSYHVLNFTTGLQKVFQKKRQMEENLKNHHLLLQALRDTEKINASEMYSHAHWRVWLFLKHICMVYLPSASECYFWPPSWAHGNDRIQ